MNDFISGIEFLENIDIFVISKGEHLNSYNDLSKTEVNIADFDGLDNLINEKLNG